MADYEIDPARIEQESFRQIRELTDLEGLSREQQQIAMRVVHSLGHPEVATQIRFSEQACEAGMQALKDERPILCDVEMVAAGVTRRMISTPPLCFLNDPAVASLARE
ncbi:MAG: precorrin-8X methylmutase, partial [Pseudomonadota bacterium]